MSKSSFEEQIMQGVYVLGSQAFAAMGAVSLILSDVNSPSDTWLFTTLSFPLMLFACRSALKGRKMVSRIRCFHNRFSSWQV